jgi:hypothetical protein
MDGHFNARGYAALARAAEAVLLERLERPAAVPAPR